MGRSRGVRGVWLACVVVIASMAGCAGESSPPTTSPSATGATAGTPTIEPSATAGVDAETIPMGGFPNGIPLEAGRYRPHPGFDVQFTVELGDGWRSIRDDTIGTISFVGEETNEIGHATHWLTLVPAPVDARPEDLLASIRDQPDLVADEPNDASIGGAAGTEVDAVAKANPAETGDEEVAPGTIPIDVINTLITGGAWFSETPRARFRFLLLDVAGRTLLVYLEAPAEEFDAFANRAEAALEGLSFES